MILLDVIVMQRQTASNKRVDITILTISKFLENKHNYQKLRFGWMLYFVMLL